MTDRSDTAAKQHLDSVTSREKQANVRARELAAAAAEKEDALVAISTRVELLTAELARVESVMHQESIKRTASDRAAIIAKDALAAKSHEVRFWSTWFDIINDKPIKNPGAAMKCI